MIHFHQTKPQETKVPILEVRLAHFTPAIVHAESSKTLLTRKSPAQFKVAQANSKHPSDTLPNPVTPATNTPPSASGGVEGISFPSSVTTPFQGSQRSISSLFHPPSAQQEASRNYYQQAMEAQARQQTGNQSRLIMQQLQQLLTRVLNVNPTVEGTCNITETSVGKNAQLACDSPALYEVIAKTQMDIVGMLEALRNMGTRINGFTAEIQADKLHIQLNNEGAPPPAPPLAH